MDKKFEEWYNSNINDLELKWQENGAWYELDFDMDREIDIEWDYYCMNKEHTT